MRSFYLHSPNESIAISSKVFLIGRAKHAEFSINHPSISKDHAYIEIRQNDRLFIKDMGSLNGTKINGQRLDKHQQLELNNNDLIQFGQYQNKFRLINKEKSDIKDQKKDRKINLKDLFSPVDSLEQQQTPVRENSKSKSKGFSKEKRINLGQMKQTMQKFNDEKSIQSQSNISINSQSNRKPKQTRIKMETFNNFYRSKQSDGFDQFQIKETKPIIQTQKIIPQAQIQKPIVADFKQIRQSRIRIQNQLNEQRQYYEQKMIEQQKKNQLQKQQLAKKLQIIEFERQQQEKKFKQQQRQYQKNTANQIELKKKQIDDKKKMIQIEAQAIGKQYEKIYKDTIQRFKNSLEKYQDIQRQLQNKINNQKQLLEDLSTNYKQQSITGQSLISNLKQSQHKNKAMLLYVNHLQQSVDKIQKVNVHERVNSKQQSEIQVLRKLLQNRASEILQLKRLSKNLIVQCSKDNPRQSYQFQILEKNTENIKNMKLQLFEYMDRQKHTLEEWQDQIKTNNQLSSKVKNILLKLKKNNQQLQQIHIANTKKICDYHQQFYKFIQKQSNIQKKKAGNFLVNQLLQIQEQRNKFQHSIQELHLKIQQLIYFTLKQRSQTTKISEILFSRTSSKFSQLDVLHDKLQSLTNQVKDLQSSEHMNSLKSIGDEIYVLQIEIGRMIQDEKNINEKINNSFKDQQTEKTALDFFSNLYSEKSQQQQNYFQEQKLLETHMQRLQNQILLLSNEHKTLSKRYEKFKTNQLLEAQRLIKS